jgi:hypothetical protein
MQALYLGTAEGKNEIDSSFDHVVHIAPMHITQAADISGKYMDGRTVTYEPAQSLALGFLSLGVARDIFRRVDEALSESSDLSITGAAVLKSYLHLQLQMAYNSYRLDKTMFNQLSTGATAENVKSLASLLDELMKKEGEETKGRVIAQLLILHMGLEIFESESINSDDLERLRDIGYRIPLDRLKDIHLELKEV